MSKSNQTFIFFIRFSKQTNQMFCKCREASDGENPPKKVLLFSLKIPLFVKLCTNNICFLQGKGRGRKAQAAKV